MACIAVAQALLRYDDERHWLSAAPGRIGHLFPRLPGQSEYNERVKAGRAIDRGGAALARGRHAGSAELLRLMDATPVPCGTRLSHRETLRLVRLGRYGYCLSHEHSRWCWGAWLLLICTCDGTVRLLALNACIWHNWMTGAPVRRSLIAYGH
jgi:hypothetical protein